MLARRLEHLETQAELQEAEQIAKERGWSLKTAVASVRGLKRAVRLDDGTVDLMPAARFLAQALEIDLDGFVQDLRAEFRAGGALIEDISGCTIRDPMN